MKQPAHLPSLCGERSVVPHHGGGKVIGEVRARPHQWIRPPKTRRAGGGRRRLVASSVLQAIRGASLEELLGEAGGGARRGPGRPPSSTAARTTSATPRARKSGRLARRSPEQIAKALDQVVALVKTKKDGLRAEQIRAALKMQSKEMPRVLQEGLAKKKLKAKGQKRATTYTCGGEKRIAALPTLLDRRRRFARDETGDPRQRRRRCLRSSRPCSARSSTPFVPARASS
jgi:hypothetical protein